METKTTTQNENKVLERKAGKASTLKSWKTLVINLKGLELTTDKDYETIKELYKKAVKQYMGEELL